VEWSQATTTKSPDLGHTRATLTFGQQSFVLEEHALENAVRVHVHGRNPRVVVSELMEQAQQVIAESIPNLFCAVLLHADGGHVKEEQDATAQACELVPWQLLEACADPSADANRVLEVAGEQLDSTHLQDRFQLWLPPKGHLEAYDVFLSYRWGNFDQTFVKKLFDCLSTFTVGPHKRRLETFLDVHRLPLGKDFTNEFMVALLRSTVRSLVSRFVLPHSTASAPQVRSRAFLSLPGFRDKACCYLISLCLFRFRFEGCGSNCVR
jgi:hypothetical protein